MDRRTAIAARGAYATGGAHITNVNVVFGRPLVIEGLHDGERIFEGALGLTII
jgi:hypothetical protein